ncbi:MerR family transcriptional regulator [Sphingomonas sp. HDW15A]|uniref:MerR family transcriptional regulator n=1 Tax=Sphingomonas sp. HDW15A TaxID=2714942 RepID=UPI00140A487F|nr:MerR family transcriptional regulator [Sphingomonas sp. HDW15A]QIK95195.1 MerR family transcriptional regulator [Sphingomonas sp. HDW15A]
MAADKDPNAFLTIGELSAQLGVPQHILRYWESKFPKLRPLQRAGNRRYYRPADADLARRIHRLLTVDGYTIRGVQKLLREGEPRDETLPAPIAAPPAPTEWDLAQTERQLDEPSFDYGRLVELRDRLASALTA